MFKLLLVLKSPGGQSTATAFSPAYLFILKGFAVRDNGTSVIRTVLCVIQRAFFGGSGPGGSWWWFYVRHKPPQLGIHPRCHIR